jgi:hypothetical protein
MSPGLAWRADRGLTAALVAAGFSSLVANPERIRRWIRLSFLYERPYAGRTAPLPGSSRTMLANRAATATVARGRRIWSSLTGGSAA